MANNNWLNPRRRILQIFSRKRRAEVTIAGMLLTFLIIMFGLALTPTVGDVAWQATRNATGGVGNLTGTAAAAIVNQIPLVWVFLIIGIGAAAVVKAFEEI